MLRPLVIAEDVGLQNLIAVLVVLQLRFQNPVWILGLGRRVRLAHGFVLVPAVLLVPLLLVVAVVLARLCLLLLIVALGVFGWDGSRVGRIVPCEGERAGSSGGVVHFGAQPVGVGEIVSV